MKSLTTTVFSFAFALIFSAGCATVTDVNADLPEIDEPTIITTTTDGSFWDSRSSDDMDPIIDRPKTGGGSLD
ncbi:hypothetical protein BH23BAC3_BH23BAC3_36310 [soil metagenome]